MSYDPFKELGSLTFDNLSGSGTLENVGNVYIGGSLNVTGAVTLDAPASGSTAGAGSQLALNSDGAVVLSSPNIRTRVPLGCYFSSSAADQLSLIPSLGTIDGKAIVPIISGSTMINVELSSTITADITDSGANGLDSGAVNTTANTGYYVFLITQANGGTPALLFSLSPTDPTMPAGYTYKSKSLFFMIYLGASDDAWRAFVSTTDGWCTAPIGYGSSLKATTQTGIDARTLAPAGGEADIWVTGQNTDNTNRNINFSRNLDGAIQTIVAMYSIRTNADHNGRPWFFMSFPINVPASGSLNDDATLYYNWDVAPIGAGLAVYAQRWRTDAYCE